MNSLNFCLPEIVFILPLFWEDIFHLELKLISLNYIAFYYFLSSTISVEMPHLKIIIFFPEGNMFISSG